MSKMHPLALLRLLERAANTSTTTSTTEPQLQRQLLRAEHVVQQEGDIMFIPEGWGHAVLNQQPSIAVAAEFVRLPARKQ
jgi:hypothetical protein